MVGEALKTIAATMKVRRRITGVLCGFLDAYSSRYSDYDGYWVFGLLVRQSPRFCFDLLHPDPANEDSPASAAAARIARERFSAALVKSGIPVDVVSEAKLSIAILEPPTTGPVNGRLCTGHHMALLGEVRSDLQKRYTAERIIFVAPHDPAVEHRSTRRNG